MSEENKRVVLSFADGTRLKGFTEAFVPPVEIVCIDTLDGFRMEVPILELKAVFFVKTFDGKPDYDDSRSEESSAPRYGTKLRVFFKDGEVVYGRAPSYDPESVGFYLVPLDPDSNNSLIYVVREATNRIVPTQ